MFQVVRVLVGILLLQCLSGTAFAGRTELYDLLQKLDTGKIAQDVEHIRLVSKYEYSEVTDALLLRLGDEVEYVYMGVRTFEQSRQIIVALLEGLSELVSKDNREQVEDVYAETIGKIGDNLSSYQNVLSALNNLVDLAATKSGHLPSVSDPEGVSSKSKLVRASDFTSVRGSRLLLPKPEGATATGITNKEYLEKIEKTLKDRVIGQPNAIEKLMDSEYQNALLGQRDKTEIFFFMGSPATGKDTTAEAYVDAIHGMNGAYEDHLYRLPKLETEADLWQVMGSSSGYIGSESFPPFLDFLVSHSGGRYKKEEVKSATGKVSYKIVENQEWIPGQVLPGYLPPESGVVFANEFHNWSKVNKDRLLKEALEKGIFYINNPNGGLDKIEVPITFILATNEGLGLVTSREANGQRFGSPLSYNEMHSKYEEVYDQPEILRNEILKSNGKVNGGSDGRNAPGVSEEFLSRIPDRAFVLMKPLSPEELQIIAEIKLQQLKKKLAQGKGIYGAINISWNKKLVKFLQEYRYVAENNARPMEDRVADLVLNTLSAAIKNGKVDPKIHGADLELNVTQRKDRTWDLKIKFAGEREDLKKKSVSQKIKATLSERSRGPISDERIEELMQIPEKLTKKVFGIERIVERLGGAILDAEESRVTARSVDEATQPARTFAFLGLSSTGKTQTAKELAEILGVKKSGFVTLDFSQIQNKNDIKDRILGTRDGLGNPIASDFMKHYDRNQGKLLVVLDEIANANPDDLKALYDILREPVVSTFSDGKPRVMSNITFIMTGNAGEEWYNGIPKSAADNVRQASMMEVHKQMMESPGRRRATLLKYFSEAFLNRIGESNIFFFGPLGFADVRRLTQLKLSLALKRLKANENRRGWNFHFKDEESYKKVVSVLESEGFTLDEQGSSIDRYINDDFEKRIRRTLIANKVPAGTDVVFEVSEKGRTVENIAGSKVPMVHFKIHVKGRSEAIDFAMNAKPQRKGLPASKTSTILTAIHEAGHELTRKVFFGDAMAHEKISILPGVTEIGGAWVMYDGIAVSRPTEKLDVTLEYVLRQMAVMFGGEVAQSLTSRGGVTDAGKSNDLLQATQLAYQAILKMGLSERWGHSVIPRGQSLAEFRKSLSEDKKKILEEEKDKLLNKAREMAYEALSVNLEGTLLPLGIELAEKGLLEKEDLDNFYKEHKVITVDDKGYRSFLKRNTGLALKAKISSLFKSNELQAELNSWVPVPDELPDFEAMTAEQKKKAVAEVEVQEGTPLLESLEGFDSLTGGPSLLPSAGSCGQALLGYDK